MLNLGTANESIQAFKVYNLQGQEMVQVKLVNQALDVTALVPGNYILQLQTGAGVKTVRFLKL